MGVMALIKEYVSDFEGGFTEFLDIDKLPPKKEPNPEDETEHGYQQWRPGPSEGNIPHD